MTSVIVFTRHDGGVSLCVPSPEIIAGLCRGGIDVGPEAWIDEQVERHVIAGHAEASVRRYYRALRGGGCTTAEAHGIIRDRDCGHRGSGFELWGRSEIPADRWFRDAWRRSHNGGPIMLDLDMARGVHYERIVRRIDEARETRRTALNPTRMPRVNLGRIRDKIMRASSAEDLRAIWPEGMS